ncbi:MAG: glycosyltransferase family 2 protein [Acidimicrobiales bacterium]
MPRARRPESITVVMPTYRRPEPLARALSALAAQRDPGIPWDLIVVDNDPGEGATSTVDAVRPRFPVPLRLVREAGPGASHARNRGIAEATGDVIALIDDDVVPDETWLASLVLPIVAGRCHATTGRVDLDPTRPRPRWFDEEGIGGYLARFDPGTVERAMPGDGCVLTCNAAFVAERLRATGGFDPRLGPRGRTQLACEDNLVTRKFLAAGGIVHYMPTAVVTHDLPRTRLSIRYLLVRSYTQGRSDWLLDREIFEAGRFHGLSSALAWLRHQLRLRRAEGLHRQAVAFHALTDIVRVVGATREMVAWALQGLGRLSPATGEPADPAGAHGQQVHGSQVPEPDPGT